MSIYHVYRPEIGERVLIVPQAFHYLINPGHPLTAVGASPQDYQAFEDSSVISQPHWEVWSPHSYIRKGYGTLVIRDGKLALGPSDLDSGD